MLIAMRHYHAVGNLDNLSSVDVGGKQGQPIETKDVSNEERARRIVFILGQAEREQGEKTPLAAAVGSNGRQYGRQLADGEIASAQNGIASL